MTEKLKKKRISTLAKKYGLTNELLLKLLKQADVEAKSAAGMIDAAAFAKIKPAVLAEQEKKERKEMAKAGIKIPMKAVIKKAVKKPAAVIVKKKEPVVVVEEKEEPPVETTPVVEEPVAKSETVDVPVKNEVSEEPAVAQTEVPVEKKEEVAEKPAPKEVEETVAEKPIEKSAEKPVVKTASFKVKIEKPDDKLAARVQKAIDEKNQRRFNRGGDRGYSGRFGKVPLSQNKDRKRVPRGPGGAPGAAPTSGGDKPRDVYAVRAQQAGVLNTFSTDPNQRPDLRKDATHGKKKGKGAKKKKKTKAQIEQELSEMKSNVSKVMATLGRGSQKTKYRKEKIEEEESDEKKVIELAEFVTISEIAGLMDVSANVVIAKCMELGMMVTINQRLDHETITILADEFGFEAQLMDEYKEEVTEDEEVVDESTLELRPPIVTIMGHVDHGKTSILDYIRKTSVTDKEAGGITQHIGAYTVETPRGQVCFLDTPGHQAFSAMRSRGAQVTDIVVLVVAADSRVMPQTKEAIQHAKNANVQLVVAINKCDLPTANVDKIKAQLSEEGVQVEDWGGKTSCVEVSARTGDGIDKLLEVLSLEAEVLELKASPEGRGKGSVIETRLDKGKGTVATVLVQNGTLKIGDIFVCGSYSGKVRSLLDDKNKRVKSVGPSTPIQVLGLEGVPQAGDSFSVMGSEKEAREVAGRRREAAKDREMRQKRHITLEQLHEQIAAGEFHEFKVIIKGDVDGSVEAIATSLEQLSTKEVKVNIISSGVGSVKDADIHLAAASNAIIVAFHVLPTESVRQLAEREGVSINFYRIIYEVVDEVRAAMEGLLSPEYVEEVTGEARILQLFKVPKIGMIAGSLVSSGSVDRDAKLRVYREGIEVGEAKVSSLKRMKDDVKSVKSGIECGIGLEGIKDIQEGDILAFFKTKAIARKLSTTEA